MSYTWVEESLRKYGEIETLRLIKQQQEYEERNADNDCKYCGRENKGSVIDWNGTPVIMHFGLWPDGNCSICGTSMEDN